MNVPETPWWQTHLLESPWWVVAVLGIVGLITVLVGRQRANQTIAGVGLGVCLLAAGAWLLASNIETDREAMLHAADELLDATTGGKADGAVLNTHLARGSVLSDSTGQANLTGLGFRLALVAAVSRADITNHHTVERVAGAADGQGVIEMKLLTQTQAVGPIKSHWQWQMAQDASGQWQLREARLLSLNNQDTQGILQHANPTSGW